MKSGLSSAPVPVISSSGDLLADRRYAWAMGLVEEGDAAAAAELLAEVTALAPGWAAGWFALAQARGQAGDRAGARAAYEHCAGLDPDDVFASRLHLARLGEAGLAPAMSAAYVRGLFDQYAAGFDAHLTGTLAYRGPEIIRDALKGVCAAEGREFRFAKVLDLGCGTGLMARAIAGDSAAIAGVDLSPRMVAQAAATGLYAELATGDVVDFLQSRSAPADLILAADVLVYIGDLMPVLKAAVQALAPAGLLAFTVQKQDEPGYSLGPDLRYHHGRAYIAGAAAALGLRLLACDEVSTRQDEGRAVPGLVVVLGR